MIDDASNHVEARFYPAGTVRFLNRFYQLLPPVHPGQRGGRVVMEQRLDGSLAIRFRDKYLKSREAARDSLPGGFHPQAP